MLRAPTVTGARRKIGVACDTRGVERKALPAARQRPDDEAAEGPSDLPEPPPKKSRRGQRSTSPRPEGAVEKKRKMRNKSPSKDDKSSSKKLECDIPRREKTRFIYNSKFKKFNKYGSCNDGASSSKEGAGEKSQDETGVPPGSVVANNNEFTEKAGRSGKRRRRHKKCPTTVDQDVMPAKTVRNEKPEKDSGVGSLADLLDEMSVGEKRKKPTATVTSKTNVFDLQKVIQFTKMKWDEDCRKAATVSALRSTVVVEGIPHPMLQHIDSSIKEFFASCGQIIHYSTHEFLQEDQYTFSATVHFGSEDAASKALARDGSCFGGVAVRVRRAGPLEWTLKGLEGRTGMATRRVDGMQPSGLIRPRLGLAFDEAQHLYYLGGARVEMPIYGHRFARAEISSDSD